MLVATRAPRTCARRISLKLAGCSDATTDEVVQKSADIFKEKVTTAVLMAQNANSTSLVTHDFGTSVAVTAECLPCPIGPNRRMRDRTLRWPLSTNYLKAS